MPWIYRQASHQLWHDDVLQTTQGYAGKASCKNRPECQSLVNQGPLPRGVYTVLAPRNHAQTGFYSMPLRPAAGNLMFGRGGFMIHGPSHDRPSDSSTGCLVLPLRMRQVIWSSGDHHLEVRP